MLFSSQTKDPLTYSVVGRLRAFLQPEDFSPISILASFDINDEHSTQSLESLLKPISFFKTKARYVFFTFLRNLLKISAILVDKYNADVPDCLDDVCSNS